MILKIPSLFIFDMDGLLLDTERLFMNERAKVLEKYGYVHREEDYIRMLGTAGDTMLAIMHEIYGPDYPEAAISKESREAELAYLEKNGAPVKPGIRTLLSWIRTQEIPCCVATATTSPYAEQFLETAGIASYFEFILTGDEVVRSKPDPDIFLRCCKQAHVHPSDALVLEDSENGVRAAYNGGIPVICIPDLKQPEQEVREMADVVLDSAEQVPALFEPNS